jgi:o-succinylbenzoate synthase
MRLLGLELVRVDVPFRREIRTAAGTHDLRTLLFVRVVGADGEGWGECGALAEGTSVDPSVEQVERAAEERGVRRLIDASLARSGEIPTYPEVAPLFATSPVDRMLAAVFEMAVADAELRAGGQSLAGALEVANGFDAMAVGIAIGIPASRDVGELHALVQEAVTAGMRRVRLKIEPGWDIEPVRTVREAFPDLMLQVDANGSYASEDAPLLARLGEFGLACVEQPLPPGDLMAHAELARRIPVPICLDESLSSPRRVLDAARNGACQVACLKPARLGGLGATRVAHASCAAAGISVFVGGFFEAGLGRAANLALAARLHQDAPGLVGDLGDPASYLSVDPCGYPPVHDGWVRVPDHPGLGAWPDEVTLGDFAARRRWFPATYT